MISALDPHFPARRRWIVVCACVLLGALVAGCTLPGVGVPRGEAPNVLQLLPPEWTPLPGRQAWATINIDGDDLAEYMLFFTYDNGAGRDERGPVGAMIFDYRDSSEEGEAGKRLSGSPVGSYWSYSVLPNYFTAYGDTGMIAPSAAAYDIEVLPITPAGEPAEVRIPGTASELVIYGGNTSITAVWWRGQAEGYGVVNLFAPAGFRRTVFIGGDDRAAITGTTGLTPLWDRSELCHAVRYRREVAEPQSAQGPTSPLVGGPAATEPLTATVAPTATATVTEGSVGDIVYARSSEGIVFCNTATPPARPYYPEGVVLAYLLLPTERRDALISGRLSAAAQEEFGALPAGESWQVMALFAPERVDIGDRQFVLDITVCAELRRSSDEPERPYLFTLRYFPRDHEKLLPDRLLIQDIWPVPQPQSGTTARCEELVPGGTPGRVREP